jgi:hypothetical protein
MSEIRRPARSQTLPEDESALLRSLNKKDRNVRASQLFHEGWTLQSIGNAFEPPIRRSTVKYWVETAPAKSDVIDVPTQSPTYKTPSGGYQRKKPLSPGIAPEYEQRLAQLSPLARQYRSGMSSTSLYASANDEYNEIIHDLAAQNVTPAEIAKAANVTFRSIARRLGR